MVNPALQAVRQLWTAIKNEVTKNANTASRVGSAGEAIIDVLDYSSPTVGANGNWWQYGADTGTKADAQPAIDAANAALAGANAATNQANEVVAEMEEFENLAAQYINALQLNSTIPAGYTGDLTVNLTAFVGKNVIITFQNGTVIYQGAITAENATSFSFSQGAGNYSVLIKEAGALDAAQIVEISSTITTSTIYGSVTVQGELTTVNVPGTVTTISVNTGVNNLLIREVVINEGTIIWQTTSGAAGPFRGCTNLRKITFPSSITTVSDSGTSILTGCINLRQIIIADGWEIAKGFCVAGDMPRVNILDVFGKAADISGLTARAVYITAANNNKLTADDILILTNKNYTLTVRN